MPKNVEKNVGYTDDVDSSKDVIKRKRIKTITEVTADSIEELKLSKITNIDSNTLSDTIKKIDTNNNETVKGCLSVLNQALKQVYDVHLQRLGAQKEQVARPYFIRKHRVAKDQSQRTGKSQGLTAFEDASKIVKTIEGRLAGIIEEHDLAEIVKLISPLKTEFAKLDENTASGQDSPSVMSDVEDNAPSPDGPSSTSSEPESLECQRVLLRAPLGDVEVEVPSDPRQPNKVEEINELFDQYKMLQQMHDCLNVPQNDRLIACLRELDEIYEFLRDYDKELQDCHQELSGNLKDVQDKISETEETKGSYKEIIKEFALEATNPKYFTDAMQDIAYNELQQESLNTSRDSRGVEDTEEYKDVYKEMIEELEMKLKEFKGEEKQINYSIIQSEKHQELPDLVLGNVEDLVRQIFQDYPAMIPLFARESRPCPSSQIAREFIIPQRYKSSGREQQTVDEIEQIYLNSLFSIPTAKLEGVCTRSNIPAELRTVLALLKSLDDGQKPNSRDVETAIEDWKIFTQSACKSSTSKEMAIYNKLVDKKLVKKNMQYKLWAEEEKTILNDGINHIDWKEIEIIIKDDFPDLEEQIEDEEDNNLRRVLKDIKDTVIALYNFRKLGHQDAIRDVFYDLVIANSKESRDPSMRSFILAKIFANFDTEELRPLLERIGSIKVDNALLETESNPKSSLKHVDTVEVDGALPETENSLEAPSQGDVSSHPACNTDQRSERQRGGATPMEFVPRNASWYKDAGDVGPHTPAHDEQLQQSDSDTMVTEENIISPEMRGENDQMEILVETPERERNEIQDILFDAQHSHSNEQSSDDLDNGSFHDENNSPRDGEQGNDYDRVSSSDSDHMSDSGHEVVEGLEKEEMKILDQHIAKAVLKRARRIERDLSGIQSRGKWYLKRNWMFYRKNGITVMTDFPIVQEGFQPVELKGSNDASNPAIENMIKDGQVKQIKLHLTGPLYLKVRKMYDKESKSMVDWIHLTDDHTLYDAQVFPRRKKQQGGWRQVVRRRRNDQSSTSTITREGATRKRGWRPQDGVSTVSGELAKTLEEIAETVVRESDGDHSDTPSGNDRNSRVSRGSKSHSEGSSSSDDDPMGGGDLDHRSSENDEGRKEGGSDTEDGSGSNSNDGSNMDPPSGDHQEGSDPSRVSHYRRTDLPVRTIDSPHDSSPPTQLQQELDSYSNIKALKAIRRKINDNYSKMKEGNHKNDLKGFMDNIDKIIGYHQKTEDEITGTTGLQNIQDLVKANPNTEKYYTEMQEIAQTPEQPVSQEQLQQELDTYSNINALKAIKRKINYNYSKIKKVNHKNDLKGFMDNIDKIIGYHQKIEDETTGTTALQNIQDLVKANPNTEKYYTEMQEITQAPEQPVSQEQLQQELDTYSNINALKAIKKRINDNYSKIKRINHKNDLKGFMDNIDKIIGYHQKTEDETTGTTALQNIQDLVKANPNTEKYYTEMQKITQAPKQPVPQEQLQQGLDTYSNIKALKAIRRKINDNYSKMKEGNHKNDLKGFVDNIDKIIGYHQKTEDETTGTTALQNIQDLVKANPNTEKYYTEMQEITQAPEQPVSQEQLQQELDTYSNINALKAIKKRISSNYSKRKEGNHKNNLKGFMDNIDKIIGYHQKTEDETTGTTALQNIQDLVKANPNTEKYYTEMQKITQAPEQV